MVKNTLTKNQGFNKKGFSKTRFQKAEVAQSVEQGTENPRVGSSILSLGTIQKKDIKPWPDILFL